MVPNTIDSNLLFQAPELSHRERLDPYKADLYSLALLVHVALLGCFLFDLPADPDEVELLLAKKDLPASLEQSPRRFGFYSRFERFLCYEPERRSCEIGEFREALEEYLIES